MPYKIRKLPKKNEYRVYNPETKEIHSYHTSLDNAEKQVRLLYMKHNEKISGKGSGASRESGAPRVPTNSELLADFPDDEFFNVNFEDDEFIDVRPTTPTIGSHRNEIVKQKVAELFERKNIDPEENKETEKLERRSIQAYALGIDLNPAEPYMKRDLQKYINRSKKYFENFMKNDPMDRFIYNSGEIPQHLRQRIERDHTEIMTSIGVFNINFLDPNHPIKAPDYNVADTIEPIILDIFNFKNELKKIKNPQLAPQQEIREAPQEEIREAEINGIGLPADKIEDTLIRPLFCRIGNKNSIIKDILRVIPPHTIYVEPFVGGGSVFWSKSKAKQNVLNDIDTQLIDNYKSLKKASLNPSDYPIIKDKNESLRINKINDFVSKDYKNPNLKVLKAIYQSCNSFNSKSKGNIYKSSSQNLRIDNIGFYIDKIKHNVVITNEDYKSILKKYDKPSTFFFLDPPYENSEGLYENPYINYVEMSELLQKLKGNFLLTLNDSPEIRKIFSVFNMIPIKVKSRSHGNGTFKKIRNELFITNYKIGEKENIEGSGLPAGDLKELLSRSYNKKPSSFGDYKLDSQLSGQRGQVYYNEKMRKAVVVHRGTKGVQDMITDIRYTLGDKSGRRFKHAKNIQELANAKYGKENVITAGHSLGSVLGETAVKGKDQELITLNKPVGLADIGKTISKKQTDIKTERDPVSFLRGTQKGNAPLVIKSTSYNPLAEHSTETLGRVDESDIIGEGLSKTYLSNIYNMPKVSSTSEFVYIPQTKQQIFGTGMSAPKYGPHTGIVKQVHFKGVGVCCGRGIPAPPSRKIAVNL